jgi:glycosyltransferase 2 family protein
MDKSQEINNTVSPFRSEVSRYYGVFLRYLFAGACIVWVFYDIHVDNFLASLTGISWKWIPLAIVFDILSYVCQGIRWGLLFRPVGRLSWVRTTQAVYAGLFTNEIVPMRFGELVRAWLVTRWVSADFVSAIPSMAVERLFDGVWLALSIGIVSLFVPLPPSLLDAAEILGALVLLGTVLFMIIVFRKRDAFSRWKDSSFRFKLLGMAVSFLGRIASGLREIGLTGSFYLSFLVSFFILVMQALAFWLIMLAYGLEVSFWVGAVVLLIVHFGTAIPNAPSNMGTYQFFTVAGLSLFGVDKTAAAGFSVIVFIILTVPLWVIGFLAVNRTGLTLKSIRDEIHEIMRKKEIG